MELVILVIIAAAASQPCDNACFDKAIDKKTPEYKDSSYPGWQRIQDYKDVNN